MQRRTFFIDVDDTLVRSVGKTRIPITPVIDRVRELYGEGAELYLWSSSGAEYARATAVELEIGECFTAFLPKPHAYIDEQPVHAWRYCRHVLPGNVKDAR